VTDGRTPLDAALDAARDETPPGDLAMAPEAAHLAAFEVLMPPGPPRPVVLHVPHASARIPAGERTSILLGDAPLAAELLALTDAHTDRLFAWAREDGATAFVNRVSRLVVDPERFADDAAEPMAAVGQGAVYTRTSWGAQLRAADAAGRARLLAAWFEPYHAALEALVARTLDRFGRCLVLDGHSFATRPLPGEPDQDPRRPDICVGTDPFHTPPSLADALADALSAEGFSVGIDRPFTGSLVPLRWYRQDPRVASVMLEVRRGTYMDEATGAPTPAFGRVAERLRRAWARALPAWEGQAG
jgi:N-formylglutamate deformylase